MTKGWLALPTFFLRAQEFDGVYAVGTAAHATKAHVLEALIDAVPDKDIVVDQQNIQLFLA